MLGRALKNTRTAFWLHAALLTVFIGASSASSPLYEYYAREWGLGSAAVTVVFAVYAVAVLLTLLVVGSLADHVGTRPVLLPFSWSGAGRTGTPCSGAVALIEGILVTVLAVQLGSVPLYFCGTVIAGVGFGSGYFGARRMTLLVPFAGIKNTTLIYGLALVLAAVFALVLIAKGTSTNRINLAAAPSAAP